MRNWQKILLILLFIFISIELYLRLYWGFCDSVLMMANKNYEYIAQPNQDRLRFRKHVYYNSFSMRSDEIDTSATTIIGFGDSVINGGGSVDQDSTATYILSNLLTNKYQSPVQVLNISAGSWGPDNCFSYLKDKGDFNASIFFLVVSSHDAYDVMDFQNVVGNVDGYETKQYKIAIWELLNRYIFPRFIKKYSSSTLGIAKKSNCFNPGFKLFCDYCKTKNKKLFLYLNPDTLEINNHAYKTEGKQIIDFCIKNDIKYIEGLNFVRLTNYRDVIHLNESGHKLMANLIYQFIIKEKLLKNNGK